MRRAFAGTPDGQLHYRTAGEGPAVLLLHQTPRSSDEYRDVIPRLAERFRVIAPDTPGYGDSYRPARPCAIEDYAAAMRALLDALGLARARVVGHHTGAVIGLELAAGHPERVERLVLSASPFVDAADRARRRARPPLDRVEPRPDGSHLTALWQRRQPFYPPGRPDLLTRFVLDALRAGEGVDAGHAAVGAYRMEERVARVRCPVLLVCGTDDPFAWPRQPALLAALPGSRLVPVPGGTVALPDQLPDAFVAAVRDFLSEGA